MNEIVKKALTGEEPDSIKLDRTTLQSYMPKGFTGKITDEVLLMLNSVEEDTGMSEALFGEQLCSYSHLLTAGVSLHKLANAIKYCNLRLIPKMGSAKAYRIVFPTTTREKEARGLSIDSLASMYARTKTVLEIQKLLLIPTHISHAPMHNMMLQKLFDLSNGIGAKADDRVSPTVQMNAATELLNATKLPEDNNIELKIGMSDSAMDVQQNLADQIAASVALTREQLSKGVSLDEAQRIGILTDAELVD